MFLEPWIGKDYYSGINNEKILILGESHHFEEPFDNSQENSDLTTKALKDIIDNKKNIRFFSYIGQLFNQDWTQVWDKVAFANLIQYVFVSSTDQPNKEQIATIVSFWDYLELLKPDKVIVCSSRCWNSWFTKYVDDNHEIELIKDAQIAISYIFKYPYSTGKSLTIGINHPSDRKPNYIETWKPIVETFMDYKS